MNRCPITFESCGERRYSKRGLSLLSPRLQNLQDFPYTRAEQLEQASLQAAKMSIQGVQPKLSVKLNVAREQFEIVDQKGTFIIKPPHLIYPELVENEDVSMRLAAAVDIEVPVHGMIYSSDGSLTYLIRRFDRSGRNKKLAMEDFAQLSGHNRDTKYNSSMEQVALIIEQFCTFPVVEKRKLFRRTLFSFLIGNEDMHLKNFSLIRRDGKIELTPAYDLLNSTIVLRANDELALPLMGKKSGFRKEHFVDYFARERMGLLPSVVAEEIERLERAQPAWESILRQSFLSEMMKDKYLRVVSERSRRIFG